MVYSAHDLKYCTNFIIINSIFFLLLSVRVFFFFCGCFASKTDFSLHMQIWSTIDAIQHVQPVNCVIHVWCSSLNGAAHLVHHFLFAACRFVIENDFCGLNEGSISIAWRFRNIPMFLSFRGVYQTDKWIRTEKIGALLKHISGAYICHHHYFLLLLLFHFNDSIKKYTNWKSNRF